MSHRSREVAYPYHKKKEIELFIFLFIVGLVLALRSYISISVSRFVSDLEPDKKDSSPRFGDAERRKPDSVRLGDL